MVGAPTAQTSGLDAPREDDTMGSHFRRTWGLAERVRGLVTKPELDDVEAALEPFGGLAA